jgi:hypothetical protein
MTAVIGGTEPRTMARASVFAVCAVHGSETSLRIAPRAEASRAHLLSKVRGFSWGTAGGPRT